MPLRITIKASFQKAFDHLPQEKQVLAVKAIEALSRYFQNGEAPYGLRIKKLYQAGPHKIFEARLNLDLRMVWVQTKEEIIFSLLGNHEDIRRFLKRL